MHKPSNGGAPVEIDVAYERFLGPEMFFHPVSKLSFNIFNFKLNTGIHSSRLAYTPWWGHRQCNTIMSNGLQKKVI